MTKTSKNIHIDGDGCGSTAIQLFPFVFASVCIGFYTHVSILNLVYYDKVESIILLNYDNEYCNSISHRNFKKKSQTIMELLNLIDSFTLIIFEKRITTNREKCGKNVTKRNFMTNLKKNPGCGRIGTDLCCCEA